MTTLREKVAEAIEDAVERIAGSTSSFVVLEELRSDDYRQISDAAISAVFDALLSDTAVEAFLMESNCRPWYGDTEYQDARESLKAAMAALTADGAQTGEPQ